MNEPLKGKIKFGHLGDNFSQEDVASAVRYLKEQLKKQFEGRKDIRLTNSNDKDYSFRAGVRASLGFVYAYIDEAFADV